MKNKKSSFVLPLLLFSLTLAGCGISNNSSSETTNSSSELGTSIIGSSSEDEGVYFTVTFNPSNGSPTFTQRVLENTMASKPNDPTKTGYVFDGWYANTDELWVFAGYPVTENITLTAKYTIGTFTITLDANGGELEGPTTYDFTYLDVYTLPTPEKFGCRFGGWENAQGQVIPQSGTYTFAIDLSLTARWDALYVVSFDSNGGSLCPPIYKYDYEPIDELPIPEKNDSIFEGWYLRETKVETPFVPTDYESVTLVAHWRLITADFTYRLINDNNEVEIVTYIGTNVEVVIPSTIVSKPVTAIASDAFMNNISIIKITGAAALNTIGVNSFKGCIQLREVHLPGLITIGENSLLGCESLELLSLGSPTNALLNAFNYNESYLPSRFTEIRINKNFTSTDINSFLFKSINERTFVVFVGAQVANFSFSDCERVKSVSFDDNSGITSIPNYAFDSCKNLVSISIPNNVRTIGTYAFYYCTKLLSVLIPNGVTSIGAAAFYSCSNLHIIAIPNSITSISQNAFNNCNSLSRVYFGGTISYWFNNVTISSGNTILGKAFFEYETDIVNFDIVDDGSFIYLLVNGVDVLIIRCSTTNFTSLDLGAHFLGKQVVSLAHQLFANCSQLTSIVVPDSVTFIGEGAFYSCGALKSVTLPSTLSSIGDSTFFACLSLASIVLPNTITSIGIAAFSNCIALKEIVIPINVTSVGYWAFYGCNLLTIKCEATSFPSGWDINWNPSGRPVVWGYAGS